MKDKLFGAKNPREALNQAAAIKQRLQARDAALARAPKEPQDSFQKFSASELYCQKCKQAMPVREKLLLYLPSGEVYDYVCAKCGSSVGSRKTSG